MPKQVLTDRSRRVLERVIRSSQAIAIPAILVLVLAVAGCSNETPVTPGDAASLDPVETGDSVAPADPGTSGEDGDSAQPGDTTNPGDTTPVEDHVENPADGPADDPIEPSVDIPSIEDLAAKILESKQIQLGWSVPLELGTVTDGARIQIRVASPGTEELAIWELEHQWEDLVVVADEALGLPGSTSTIEIDRPQKSGLTYFGLRILDLEGGTGPLSNATGLDLRAEPCVLYPDGSGAFEDMRAIVAHIRDTGENCEVELAPGTYTGQGNRDWDGVGLSVPIRVHAPEGATFDFQGEPGVLTANVRFVGVTFENSPSLRVTVQSNSNGGRFLAEGCAFENIVVEVADGAFGENPGEMTLIDCEVRRCEARDENGILQAGVLEARRSQILDCDGPIQRGIGLKLSDCTIEDCRNESGSPFMRGS